MQAVKEMAAIIGSVALVVLCAVVIAGGYVAAQTQNEFSDTDVDGDLRATDVCVGYDDQDDASVTLNGDDDGNKSVDWSNNGTLRWGLGASGTEAGSDAGADLELRAYTDAGVLIDKPVELTRAATGVLTINRAAEFAATIDAADDITSAGTVRGEIVEAVQEGDAGVLYARTYLDDYPYGLVIFDGAQGTEATPTAVEDDQQIGSCLARGYDGTNFIRSSRIDFWVDGTPGTNDMPGRMTFGTTADGASTCTARFILDSTGAWYPSAGKGVDKTWSAWKAADGLNIMAGTCAAAAPVFWETGGAVVTMVLAFDKDTDELAVFPVGLPADYNGSALKFELSWSAEAGTGGDVDWVVGAVAFGNDDSLNDTHVVSAGAKDSWIANKDLHTVECALTPYGATGGELLHVTISRDADDGTNDTFDGDADLVGVRVGYDY